MLDPALEALWKQVLDDWNDDARHTAFLEYCHTSDQLLEAAVRYRGMSADRDRSESAQKRLKGIALMAMSRLESERTTPRQARRQAAGIVLILVFFSASLAMLWLGLR